jgi:hypothetical protein
MGYEHYLAYYKTNMSHVIWSRYFHMVIYYVGNLWSLADPKELWLIWTGESKIDLAG